MARPRSSIAPIQIVSPSADGNGQPAARSALMAAASCIRRAIGQELRGINRRWSKSVTNAIPDGISALGSLNEPKNIARSFPASLPQPRENPMQDQRRQPLCRRLGVVKLAPAIRVASGSRQRASYFARSSRVTGEPPPCRDQRQFPGRYRRDRNHQGRHGQAVRTGRREPAAGARSLP